MSNDTQHTPNIKARLFFEKFFVPRGLSVFFSGLGDFKAFKDLRAFMPRGSGRHCFTVNRGCHRGDCRFFYSLDLRLSRERGRASARQIKLLSIFSLEYIYLLYSLFLMLLLVACWKSVGCLLDVCWTSVVRSVGRMLRRIANVHFHWDL